MVSLISTGSNYIIVIMGVIYAITCFTVFLPSTEKRQVKRMDRQELFMFVFHFTGHGENLIIYTGNSGLVIDTASGRVFVDRGTAEHTYRMNYLGQNDSAKLTAQIKKVLKI